MKFAKLLVASAAFVAVMSAQAEVTAQVGGGYGSFLTLFSAGLAGGSVATLSGGAVYAAGQLDAAMPVGTMGNFLAAGPSAGTGGSATLTFTGAGVDYISFLWGSPDTYNLLTVSSTGASQTFAAADFGFSPANGDQSVAGYVQFTALAGGYITSLTFNNVPTVDAFETANYSITPVPEPQTYALLIAGLGAVGFITRRRKS